MSNDRVYFTAETEQAILEYNQTEDSHKRNRLYNDKIAYAFDKLAENTIHVHKLRPHDLTYVDLKTDIISHLIRVIHKYNEPSKGKAYSYFSVAARNHGIAICKKNYEKRKNTETIDELDFSYDDGPSEEDINFKKEFIKLFIDYIERNVNNIFKNQTDRAILDSIVTIFRKNTSTEKESVDTPPDEDFDKKSLWFLLRERSNCETTEITNVVKVLKKMYKECYNSYVESGILMCSKVNKDNEFFIY